MPDPLRVPLRSFTIGRDEKLHIILETKAEQNARSAVPDHPLGTVRVNAERVSFSGTRGSAVAHGVQPKSHAATIRDDPAEGESREASDVNSLEVTLNYNTEAGHVCHRVAGKSGRSVRLAALYQGQHPEKLHQTSS